MLLTKDHAERATIVFDFGPMALFFGLSGILSGQDYVSGGDYFAGDYLEGSTVTLLDPEVEVSRNFGDNTLVADGAAVLDGLKVLQALTGGTPGAVYDVAAFATFANGDRRGLAHTLRVS